MKDRVNVTVVQFASEQTTYDASLKVKNVDKILNYIRQYGKACDLIVFPELATVGYIHIRGYAPLQNYKYEYWNAAEDIRTSHVLSDIEKAANEADCICTTGFAEKSIVKGEIFNSAALVEPGRETRFQRKLHLPTEENHFFIPGSKIETFDTRIGKLGIAICYDFVFPETIRIMALKGVEIAVIIADVLETAYFKEMSRSLPIARAIENQIHVVFCNTIGVLKTKKQVLSAFGESKIINSMGTILAEAPADHECIINAVLTKEDLERGTMFLSPFRDRRPDLYGTITDNLNY
jgi:N-carbamoylputrescine amidase